jgi:hypothetical protein
MANWKDIGFFNITRRFLRRCIGYEVKLKPAFQEEKTKKNEELCEINDSW